MLIFKNKFLFIKCGIKIVFVHKNVVTSLDFRKILKMAYIQHSSFSVVHYLNFIKTYNND